MNNPKTKVIIGRILEAILLVVGVGTLALFGLSTFVALGDATIASDGFLGICIILDLIGAALIALGVYLHKRISNLKKHEYISSNYSIHNVADAIIAKLKAINFNVIKENAIHILDTRRKRTIAIISAVAVAFIIGAIAMTGARAHTYELMVQSICAEDYDSAVGYSESLSDNYKDTANVQNYLAILCSYDEDDRKEYASTLENLDSLEPFKDDRLNEHYDEFHSSVSSLEKQYEKDKSAANVIIEEIDSDIPNVDEITLSDKEKIEKVRADYDNCRSGVQELVSNISTLTNAEKRIVLLEQAQMVIDKIDAIGTVTLDSKTNIDDAQNAYDSLSTNAKPYVTNLDTLDKAQEQLETLEAAQEVVDSINNIGTVTLASESTLNNIQTAYDNLSDDAKKHVTNLDKFQKAKNDFESLRNSSGNTEPDDASVSGLGKYYWVSSGKVYHTTKDCPTLARSKNIISGSTPPAGRHVCKVCS